MTARRAAGSELAAVAWVPVAALLLSVAGVGVAGWLTIAHYTSASILACSSHGLVNCEQVTTSPESVIAGVPVAVLGLAWFLAMTALNTPRAWRSVSGPVHTARLAGSVAGMAFVLYLVYAELFRIGAICLWCTAVHVLTFCLFVLVVLSSPRSATA